MMHYTRKRQTAGNICLVLFTALLLSMIITPITMAGDAWAATNSDYNVTSVEKTNGQWSEVDADTIVGTASSYNLLVSLAVGAPLTDYEFNTLRVDFDNGDGKIVSVYAKNFTPDSVYYNTYSKVYSLVYVAPTSFNNPAYNTVYGKAYIGSQNLFSVILTLDPYVPIDRGHGGGGSDSTSTTVGNSAVQPASQFVGAKAQDVVIKTGNVSFSVPAGALGNVLADLLKADPNTKVTFQVKEVTPAAVKLADKMASSSFANLKAVGKIYSFDIIATSGGKTVNISQFSKKLKVTIPYNANDLGGLKEDTLVAYWVKDTGLTSVGGTVDKVAKQVSFETEHFSNYTLMAKTASFADIVSHWAKNDIELMVEKGIVKGVSDNSFAPDTTITRAQFATLLVRALGLAETKPAQATFKDVSSTAWYYGAVETAAAKGLVQGFNGTFSPEGKITRQEMAVMVTRALKVGGKAVTLTSAEVAQQISKFSDKQEIASWANEGVAVAAKEAIVNGRTATTFAANANATRAEGAVMIKRVLGSLGKL